LLSKQSLTWGQQCWQQCWQSPRSCALPWKQERQPVNHSGAFSNVTSPPDSVVPLGDQFPIGRELTPKVPTPFASFAAQRNGSRWHFLAPSESGVAVLVSHAPWDGHDAGAGLTGGDRPRSRMGCNHYRKNAGAIRKRRSPQSAQYKASVRGHVTKAFLLIALMQERRAQAERARGKCATACLHHSRQSGKHHYLQCLLAPDEPARTMTIRRRHRQRTTAT